MNEKMLVWFRIQLNQGMAKSFHVMYYFVIRGSRLNLVVFFLVIHLSHKFVFCFLVGALFF